MGQSYWCLDWKLRRVVSRGERLSGMTPDDLLAGSISEGMLENCSLTPTHQQASAPGLTADVLHQDLAHILARTTSEFILENLPSSVSAVVAYVRDMLPRVGFSDKNAVVRVCGALTEALDNAVHHGNLELSSDLRQGINDGAWHAAIAQRRHAAPYKDRRIYVTVEMSKSEVAIKIRDEGPGFDHTKLPDPTDECNLERCSGRGVFLVRNLMDEVRFNDAGNEITLIKRSR